MISADLIQHDHLKWRRCCALLVETTNMKSVCARTAVQDSMQRPLITMKREDDWLVGGEEIEELRFTHAVRMHFGRK
jgi:hypothetical protein